MKGLICFISFMVLVFGIESFSFGTDLILLAIFWISSRGLKYERSK